MQTQIAPLSPPLVYDRDREFDQTARSDERSETPGPRTVSPSILEHRILMLKNELRIAKDDNILLAQENAELRRRIAGFERIAAAFADKLDEMDMTFKTITGTEPAEFVADRPSAQPPTPAPHDLSRCHRPTANCSDSIFTTMAACQLPDGHAGECSGEG